MVESYIILTAVFTAGVLALMHAKSGWWFLAFMLWDWEPLFSTNWAVLVTAIYMVGIFTMAIKKSGWWFVALLLWNWAGLWSVLGFSK